MKNKKQVWAGCMIGAILLAILAGIAGFVVPFVSNADLFQAAFDNIATYLKFQVNGLETAYMILACVYAGLVYLLILVLAVLIAATIVKKQWLRFLSVGSLLISLVFFIFIGGLTVEYWSLADVVLTTNIILTICAAVLLICAVASIIMFLTYAADKPDPIVADHHDEPMSTSFIAQEPVKEEEPKPIMAAVAAPAEAPEAKAEEKPSEEPAVEETPEAEAPVTKKEVRQSGKYEVFPEAGFYKYRLKANNGEILLVSAGYKTRDGAKNGIATLKKNLTPECGRIKVDKNGYAQFVIYTSNESRLIVAGEIYQNANFAQAALDSVKKFGKARRIIDLEEIPESELREWIMQFGPVTPMKNGKFEVFIDEESKKWKGRLLANNGTTLLVTSNYSSKNAVLNAFENMKSKILGDSIAIGKDKQGRYQFRVYSENGSVMVMGETYPSRDGAYSAANSVRNFIADAKIVDLTKATPAN